MGSDRLVRQLCWALVVLAIATAIVGLGLQLDLFTPFPEVGDNVDFVDRLVAFRTYDAAVYGFILISSLASIGVFLIGAMLGVALRPFASGVSLRDVMVTLFVVGGTIGIVSQLVNIGVEQVSSGSYCDCGYRTEEVIAQNYALDLGRTVHDWLELISLALVGVAVALAGRLIQISKLWRLLSSAIAVVLLLSVAFRVLDPYFSHEPGLLDDLWHLSDWLVPVAAGILVPVWAVILARSIHRLRIRTSGIAVAHDAPAADD